MMAKYPCKYCNSSDGAEYYEDTSLYHCFVCEKTWKGTEEGGNTVPMNEFKNETLPEVVEITSKIRGISPEIYKQFSYGKGANGEHIAQMYDSSGKIVAAKKRFKDKTFSWVGDVKEAQMFGQNLWRSHGKAIYITEGEIDAMSIAEGLGGKYPVVSVTSLSSSYLANKLPSPNGSVLLTKLL